MKTLFIDFGNVVAFFDHQRAVRQLVDFTPYSAEQLTQILYNNDIEDQYEVGKLNTDQYVEHALKLGQLRCDAEQFISAFVDIFTANEEVCSLIPRLAKRYRLVLASNTNDAHYRRYTQQFADVLAYFSALCPSHQVGWRKPHPRYFESCQGEALAEPPDCLFLDDMAVNTEAALQHGWHAIQYRPNMDLTSQLQAYGIELS